MAEVKKAKFMIMPAPPGTCPECAVKHDPILPHNKDSLYYQYAFYGQHGRWPTWADAMAHCSEEMKEYWTQALTEKGIQIGGGQEEKETVQ